MKYICYLYISHVLVGWMVEVVVELFVISVINHVGFWVVTVGEGVEFVGFKVGLNVGETVETWRDGVVEMLVLVGVLLRNKCRIIWWCLC